VTSPGNPRLRAVEAFPVEHEGQRCIALRDPAGFTDQIAVLPGPLLDLVSLFDGEHPLAAIQEIVRRRHGEAPSIEQIRGLAERLDDAGFLDSARFEARRRATDLIFTRRRELLGRDRKRHEFRWRLGGDRKNPMLLFDLPIELDAMAQTFRTAVERKVSLTRPLREALLAIARTEPDYQIRRRTISYLGRSEDPRVKQALKEIVER
jgi:hypothetical protein